MALKLEHTQGHGLVRKATFEIAEGASIREALSVFALLLEAAGYDSGEVSSVICAATGDQPASQLAADSVSELIAREYPNYTPRAHEGGGFGLGNPSGAV